MPRQQPNRSPLNRHARRGLEAAFWIIFGLAIAVGGPGAMTGLPRLAEVMTPSDLQAEAGTDWQTMIVHPLDRTPDAIRPDPAPPAKSRAEPYIAIVIDDMGGDIYLGRRAIALPKDVSLSFLPYPPDTPHLAEEAHRAGHEVLVHVPMESPKNDPSMKLALSRELTAEENVRRLDWALSRVPGHAGINNHEGSLFTADRMALIPVAEALYGRTLYFLDSRTTPLTQVVTVARAFGVPSSDRDVFLDDDPSPQAVQAQLRELEKTARAQGVAIAIGHPHLATLDALDRWITGLSGYRLVPAATAIRLKTEWEMGVELAEQKAGTRQ